jgi:hypothetical protein
MPVVSAALLLLSLASPQAPEATRRIAEAAQAARAIARDIGLPEWGVRLIQSEVVNAKTDEDKAELELGLCDVLRTKADLQRDAGKRLQAYAEAGAAYSRLLETYGSTTVAQRAQSQVGLTAYYYSLALDQVFASGAVSDEELARLLAEAEPFFKQAIKAMNGLIEYWEKLPDTIDDKENLRFELYYPTQFYRGITYTAWARLNPQDSLERNAHSERALEYLNNFALSAGGPYAMNAYKLAADVHVLRREYDSAQEYYVYVIDTCREILANPNPDDPLSPFIIGRFESSVQDATLGYLGMLREAGREADFTALVTDFEKWMKDQKVVPQEGGFRIRLLEANALVDQGRISEALALAQEVARENPRNSLRLQANAAMAYAIQRAPPEAEISLEILFQAAEGSQQSGEFERAITFWRVLISRLPGSPKEAEYLSQAYLSLASAWHQVGDSLLAGAAAAAGCRAGYDDITMGNRLAKQWFAKSDSLYRSRPTDDVLKLWNNDALEEVKRTEDKDGSNPDAILFRDAENKFRNAEALGVVAKDAKAGSKEADAAVKAYREAATAYQLLKPGSKFYEKSYVQRGVCSYKIIRWDDTAGDDAIQIFEDYIRYAADPVNAPRDATERKFRQEAEPTVRYYLSDSWRLLARAGRPSGWEEALKNFEGYAEKYQAEQPDLADAARDARLEAFLALGQPDAAEIEFDAILKAGSKDARVVAAAWKLQNYFGAEAEKAKASGPEARNPLLVKTVKYLGIMNERTAAVTGDSLYREASMRIELSEWANSEKLLVKALNDAPVALSEKYRFFARAALVTCLLEQRLVGQAIPIFDLLSKEKPLDPKVMGFTIQVLAGFLIVKDNQVLEVPGDGKPESLKRAYDAATTLEQFATNDALTKNENKFRSKAWWEARLAQIYVVYRMGLADPTRKDEAKRIIASIEGQAPDLGLEVCGPDMPRKLRWIQQR